MSTTTTPVTAPVVKHDPPKIKICCACPETKRPRDDCIVRNGEENCKPLIEAHKSCLRALGFEVPH